MLRKLLTSSLPFRMNLGGLIQYDLKVVKNKAKNMKAPNIPANFSIKYLLSPTIK
ncbi:hypothetical protein D3C74_473520 [compost metagenome]